MNSQSSLPTMSPMKKTLIQAIILAIVLTAPLLFAESGVGPAYLPAESKQAATERPTAAELKQCMASQHQGFQGGIQSPYTPATITPSKSIYATSIILQHGDTHTLLPPFAVIYTPDHLQKKITRTPHGRYVPWPEFYTNHRSWLFTHQITLKQAKGQAPIKPEVLSQFKRINRIVVSIYQNHPISKLSKQ